MSSRRPANKPHKAVLASVGSGVAVAMTAYVTGTDEITWKGVVGALVTAGLIGFGTYYAPYGPNIPRSHRHRDAAGQVNVIGALVALVLLLFVLWLLFHLNGRA